MEYGVTVSTRRSSDLIRERLGLCDTGTDNKFDMMLEHFQTIGSTQTYIKESKLDWLHSDGDIPKVIFVSAEHQTLGRGKGGRKWFSDERSNCLALSAGFLVPESRLKDCPRLTQLLALAVMHVFPELNILMKWPNDLLVDGKKVGGILAELEPMNGPSYAVIIGVGLNLDIDQYHLDSLDSRWPASSLARFLPPETKIDFQRTRDQICKQFSQYISVFLTQNDSYLMNEISRRQFLLNQEILFRDGEKIVRGMHAGIDSNGGLKILSDSCLLTFHSGEIVLDNHSVS